MSEADSPEQISTVAGLMFAVGFGLTETNREAVAVQPSEFVTVTVYVVLEVGETFTVAEVPKLLLH